jgi:hypothetical protein
MGFTFTTIRPARSTPNSATGDCSVFGNITATRSPRATPGSDCRNAANARLAASISEYVSVTPKFVNAGWSAKRAKLDSSSAFNDA